MKLECTLKLLEGIFYKMLPILYKFCCIDEQMIAGVWYWVQGAL